MLEEISAPLLAEWNAFYELEPWGVEAADLFQAHVCQTVVAVNVAKGKKPPTLDQFLLLNREEPKKQTLEEMHFRMRAITAVLENSSK